MPKILRKAGARWIVCGDKRALVDLADYEFLSQFRWYISNSGYAFRVYRKPGTRKTSSMFMHREILGLTDPKMETDHKNFNKLDNRRSNLRVIDRRGNTRHTKERKGSSNYKGVTWHKGRSKWQAQIGRNYKTVYLGMFDHEEEAAQAVRNFERKERSA